MARARNTVEAGEPIELNEGENVTVVQPTDSERVVAALSEAPREDMLKTRPGAGDTVLTYIPGDEVIKRANEIFGPLGWSTNVGEVQVVAPGVVAVTVSVYAGGWTGSGVGTGIAKPNRASGDITAEAWEMAVKGAETDAVKRALVKLGDTFGLGLRGGGFEGDATPGPATEKQVNFVKRLQEERGLDITVPANAKEASELIESLLATKIGDDKATPRAPASNAPAAAGPRPVSEAQLKALNGFFARIAKADGDKAIEFADTHDLDFTFSEDGTPEANFSELTMSQASDLFKLLQAEANG